MAASTPTAFARLLQSAALRRRRLRRRRPPSPRCASALGAAQRPMHYLAIPPALFATVVEQLAAAGCTQGARVIVEKPFGHDRASAEALNEMLLRTFDESHIYRIDHYLGKEPVHNMLYFRFANAFLEPFWNRSHVAERADHHGRGLRREGPRRLLRRNRHDARRGAEPPVPGAVPPGDGAAGAHRQRIDTRREDQGAARDAHARARRPGARPVRRLPRTSPAWPPTRAPRPSPRCACMSTPGAGRTCPSTSAPARTCR